MGKSFVARGSNKIKSYVDLQDLLEVNKDLLSNDFTNENKEKLDKSSAIFEFSLSPDSGELFNDDIYIQTVPQEKVKSTDTAGGD